ncbi:hypothetical protein PFISCL1PPCAC_20510, partial [Pristionchus fissidentatus]
TGNLECQGLCTLTILNSVIDKGNFYWRATLVFRNPKEDFGEDYAPRANLTQCIDKSTVLIFAQITFKYAESTIS